MSTVARYPLRRTGRLRRGIVRPFAPYDQLIQEVYFFDDFLGYAGISGNTWTNGGSGGTGALATTNTNGVWQINCISSTTTYNRYLVMANQTFSGRQKTTVTWRCKVSATTNFFCEIGLAAISSGAPSTTTYACFRFATATSANWYTLASNAGSLTSSDTGIAADTNWHEFELSVVSNTHLIGRIDRVPCPVVTTNLPTDASFPSGTLAPFIWIQNVGKNIKNLQADYCEIYCDRS